MLKKSLWTKDFEEIINKLFSKDEGMLNDLVEEINKNGSHFKVVNYEKILGMDDFDVYSVIAMLSAAAHMFTFHKEDFESEVKHAIFTDDVKTKFYSCLKKINEKGFSALNLKYLGELQLKDEDNKLSGTKDELYLKSVYDDNGKIIGQIPLIKFSIETFDSDGSKHRQNLSLPLHLVKSISNHFNQAYLDNLENIKNYKSKIGDSVVLYEDE